MDYPLGQPVERLVGEEWISDCLLANGSNPDEVIVTQIGNLNKRYTNLRWGMDVRACESAFKQSEPVPFDPAQLDLTALPF